jgi:long-chain fatty acid transport protein
VTFGNLGIAKYTEFGQAKLSGSAMAYGFHLGFHGNIASDWQLGGRVLSQLVFSYDNADATFTQTPTNLVLAQGNVIVPNGASAPVDPLLATQFAPGGPLVAQGVTTEIAHPAQVQVGVAYTGLRHTTLSADYSWVGWKSFQSLPVNFLGPAKSSSRVLEEDYNNTSAIRLGAEYRLTTGFGFRGGFVAAASAAPAETVTPLLPEMDRQLGMFGVSVPLWQKQWTFDASYAHVFTPGSRGRIDERVNGSTQAAALALNNGAYTLSANIWSFGLVYAH